MFLYPDRPFSLSIDTILSTFHHPFLTASLCIAPLSLYFYVLIPTKEANVAQYFFFNLSFAFFLPFPFTAQILSFFGMVSRATDNLLITMATPFLHSNLLHPFLSSIIIRFITLVAFKLFFFPFVNFMIV
ncbi:hypothetical protein BJV82DRAFT_78732 [Fennellomyces sp. T-0311]|nr:hypothetical protein BJV82DRAFT_78732 [Fennellomyces sp. T-0311]